MGTLRTRTIRLAYSNPSLRPHLLPILTASMDDAQQIMDLVNRELHTFGDGPKLSLSGRKITTTLTTGILEHFRDEPGHRIDDQDEGYREIMDKDAERDQERLWKMLEPFSSSIRQVRVKRSPRGRGLMDLEITLA